VSVEDDEKRLLNVVSRLHVLDIVLRIKHKDHFLVVIEPIKLSIYLSKLPHY